MAFISLFIFIVMNFLAWYVLTREARNPINRTFFLFALSVAFFALYRFSVRLTPVHIKVLVRGISVAPFVLAFFAHFVFSFTGRGSRRLGLFCCLLIYGPAVGFSLLNLATGALYAVGPFVPGNVPSALPGIPFAYYLYFAWGTGIIALSFFWSIRYYHDLPHESDKKEYGVFVVGLGILMVLAIVVLGVYGFFDIILPDIFVVFGTIIAGYLSLAIFKYRMFDITPSTAAEDIIALIPEAFFLVSTEGRLLRVNRATLELLGYAEQELLGESIEKIFVKSDSERRQEGRTAVKRSVRECMEIDNREVVMAAKDGTQVPVLLSKSDIRDSKGRTAGCIFIARDLTERQKFEEEIRQSQKLEALGTLAAGIAHDFNNFLSAILTNTSLARLRLEPSGEMSTMFEETEKAARLAADLSRQLLTFAKGGDPVRTVAAVSPLIRNSVNFALRGSNITCNYALSDELWAAEIDKGQISQVLTNIVINAKQAMTGGGTLAITADNLKNKEGQHGRLAPGEYVKIGIIDQGVGIPPQHLKRVFDPFFSTKPNGTGLGLSISYSIVRKHGGDIEMQSKPNQGTIVTVYLPALSQVHKEETRFNAKLVTGSGTILLMEDDELVRNSTRMLLEAMGYKVETVENGEKAIARYREAIAAGVKYKAVIMDLTVVGGMGGREAILRLREIDPDVRAVASSGYSNDPVMARYREYGFRAILPKPFTIDALTEVLGSM
jgi:PAS domain S-box-containing protein